MDRTSSLLAQQRSHRFEQGQRPQAMAVHGERLVEERQELRHQISDERLHVPNRWFVDPGLATGGLDGDQLDAGMQTIDPRTKRGRATSCKRKAEQSR